ncbi:MAG: hypothetical protein Q8L48_21765 [Archangium sp.]|nr:hypothetical protein [Archangium sp.]
MALLGIACTPAPAPPKPERPHPYFEIDFGAHANVECVSCHALTNTNFAQFECTGCHDQATVTPRHAAVSGFEYASPACYACHATAPGASDPTQNVAVTALVPTWSNTTILSVTATDESLPMGMNHASAPGSSCADCHVNADLGHFYPGQLHGSLLALMQPQPTTCAGCHAASAPVGFVGPTATRPARTPPSGEMKHDAVAWAAGAPTTTALVTADCSTCHVAPSILSAASWKTNASFHAALAVQPTSCLDCHANTRPGLLTSTNAALPLNVVIDHQAAVWLGDCVTCHGASTSTWAGGRFHPAGVPTPPSCLPCHEAERPTFYDGGWSGPPFDYVTNVKGIPHGDGQDCAVCHRQDAGPQPDWRGGSFLHGPASRSATTCVVCHTTQRPTVPVFGFDHSLSGTGDCFGCHQQTTQFTQLSDWDGGQQYPGANLISSTDQFITVTQVLLRRGGPNNLVTGTASTRVTLFNAMLHTSSALPADAGLAPGAAPGDPTTCWHCHTSTPGTTNVVSFAEGRFHASLTGYRSTPDAGITSLGQPTDRCADCHSNMRPRGIVQVDAGVRPMDHFADAGTVSQLDCSTCHASPGGSWSDGVFHANGPPQPGDCTGCHFTLMAEAPVVDVISAASPSYQMKHRSTQLTFQRCDRCHATALSSRNWRPGAFHANLTPQPGACVDCHGGTTPTHASQSALNGQWMNHAVAVVTAKDCAFCHAADAKPVGGQWSTSTRFHLAGNAPTTCQSCHGPANGGTGHNVPAGLIDTATITSASASTGRAGVNVQLSHEDLNVTARDCNFCHTAPGTTWDQASFHARFTGGAALVMNGSTGRCSNCHLNVKPDPGYAPQNHAAFTGTSPIDCASCHGWPGTGTPAAPNWRRAGAAAAPPTISVGGFTIGEPPAPNATTLQAGLNNLAHPAVSGSCTTCHATASGGRGAHGYDHALAPATGCASCHEAGSDLVGSPWTLNAPGAAQLPAQCGLGSGTVADRGGDTRPVGITSLACSASAASLMCGTQNCALNHFFPADCGECHLKPAGGTATTQTGAGYVGRWRFQHFFGAPAQQSTCCKCHAGPSCRG